MHPDLLRDYRARILPCIEDPIREVVNALWGLPFVVDTFETCSGHIVTNNAGNSCSLYGKLPGGLYLYPHDIRLGIDFSQEHGLGERAGAFRRDMASIEVDIGLQVLFKSVCGYRAIDGTQTEVLHVFYSSSFPDRDLEPPKTGVDEYIRATEARLIDFWEAFALLLKRYNPETQISPIAGKNFSQIIDWADLGDSKRHIFR
ncbi:hypothetical protein HYW21_02365 [Candidatus Woesearchaeota archaeon]|nr:hypothetical protein [Candidatus Woesearchaeota archaeon]